MHVLARTVARTCAEDAVHCEDGCSALRGRMQCTAGESSFHAMISSFHAMIPSFHAMISSFHAVFGLRQRDKSAKVIDYNDQGIRVRE